MISYSEKEKYYVICHIGANDPFCAVVNRGVEDASLYFGVRAEFSGPVRYDVKKQVEIFNNAIDENAAGIAVSITKPDMWVGPLKRALDCGIPVVAFNARENKDFTGNIPYLSFVGIDEEKAAQMITRYMVPKLSGVKRAVVATQETGHSAFEKRADTIMSELKKMRGIPSDYIDATHLPAQGLNIFTKYFKKNPDTGVVFSLSPIVTVSILKYIKEFPNGNRPRVAAYDLNMETFKGIKDKIIDVTVDQQPYLQGFIPVMQLFLNRKYALRPDNYNTAMGLVDRHKIDEIGKLIEKGFR